MGAEVVTVRDVPGPTWDDESFVEDLTAPFPENEVKWTISATKNKNTPQQMDLYTPYLNADSIRDRLDKVAGPGGWAVDYEAVGEQAMICRLTIHGVSRADVGEPGDQARQPWKAAATDAIKRAAVNFGIGRYLHKVGGQWRKPDSAPPRPRQNPPQAATRPTTGTPNEPPAPTPTAGPEAPFRALLGAHDMSANKAATLLGAMKGNDPNEGLRIYVAALPGTEDEKWRKATDNLSRALAEELLNQ